MHLVHEYHKKNRLKTGDSLGSSHRFAPALFLSLAARGSRIPKDDVAAIRWLFSSGSFRDQGHKPPCKGSVGWLKQLEAWKKTADLLETNATLIPTSPPPTVYHSFLTTVGEFLTLASYLTWSAGDLQKVWWRWQRWHRCLWALRHVALSGPCCRHRWGYNRTWRKTGTMEKQPFSGKTEISTLHDTRYIQGIDIYIYIISKLQTNPSFDAPTKKKTCYFFIGHKFWSYDSASAPTHTRFQVRRLHSRVDFNGSGALDVAEFIRFMCLGWKLRTLNSVHFRIHFHSILGNLGKNHWKTCLWKIKET